MCGLVSIISKKQFGFSQKDIELFDQLLLVDQLRGTDSTGVITVEADGGFHIDKEAVDSYMFQLSNPGLESRKRAWEHAQAFIGHNRKSTVGKTTDATAHPFVIKDRFAFVHNGTLWDHDKLAKTEVDSEAMAIHLEEAINKENSTVVEFQEALSLVEGAYACIWFNQLNNTIQLIRNTERTLAIAETPEAFYIASEGAMLHWILSRNSISNFKLEAVPPDVLYTFHLDKILSYNTSDKHGLLTKTDIVIKKPTPIGQKATGPMGFQGTSVVGNVEEKTALSKNKYKSIRSLLMGREIQFSVDDYVAMYYPTVTSDYYVMGTTDSVKDYDHLVKGQLNTEELDIYAPEYLDHYEFVGKVTSTEFDKFNGVMEIFVTNIQRVIPKAITHTSSNDENTTALH